MDFTKVLRGYDTAAVDDLVSRIEEARTSPSQALRAEVRELARTSTFERRFRGYDVPQVDDYLQRAAEALA
jgi:DivIVA domain-containing protein